MTTVVVVGLLAAIALPGYSRITERQKIQQAATKRIGKSSAVPTETALVTMLFDAVGAPDPSAGRPAGKSRKPRKPRTS